MSTHAKPSIIPGREAETPIAAGSTFLTRLGRSHMLAQLAKLRDGELRIVDGAETFTFGQRTPHCALTVTLTVTNPHFWADAAFGGTVGAGEAYIHGLWHCDDLTGLVRLMVVNREIMEGMEGGWASVSNLLTVRLGNQ